ncbi:MAG: DUF445 domain-containing protein [Puniceicoccales bacterium]
MNPDIASELLRLAWIPFVTAFIGWLTNWLAIQMLFRPRQPWPIFGFKVQGLVPRRHEDIADRVAEVVEEEFLSQHLIRDQLNQLDVHGYVDQFIGKLIHQRLGRKLRSIPLIGGMINDNTLAMLEKMALDSVHEEIEPLRNRLADDLETRLQVRQIVRDRILAFEMERLEGLVRRIANREFQLIEILGGALGFIVGLAQVGILLAIG